MRYHNIFIIILLSLGLGGAVYYVTHPPTLVQTSAPQIIVTGADTVLTHTAPVAPARPNARPRFYLRYAETKENITLHSPFAGASAWIPTSLQDRVKLRYVDTNDLHTLHYPSALINDTTPPHISNALVTRLTISTTMITWTTDEFATSAISYRISPSSSNFIKHTDYIKQHHIHLTNLVAKQHYTYTISSTDLHGNRASLVMKEDTTPPRILGYKASDITTSTAVITWATDELATTVVRYGLTTSTLAEPLPPDATQTITRAGYAYAHEVTLTQLIPGQTYNYQLVSTDMSGNNTEVISPTLQTSARVAISYTLAFRSSQVTVTWESQAEVGIANFGLTRKTGIDVFSYLTLLSAQGAGHRYQYVDRFISPGTTYTYTLIAYRHDGDVGKTYTRQISAPGTHVYLPLSLNRSWAVDFSGCLLEYPTHDQPPLGNHTFDTAAPLGLYTGQTLAEGTGYPTKTVPADLWEDFYRLDAPTLGSSYRIKAVPEKTLNYDLGIVVYDAQHRPILTNSTSSDGHTASLTLEITHDGPYYLKIFQHSDQCQGDKYTLIYTSTPP